MPLPAMSVTWNAGEVPGVNDGTELTELPVSPGTVLEFEHNIGSYPLRWAGQSKFIESPIVVAVNPDGSISSPSEPVLLPANDPGWNFSPIRWTVTIRRPGRSPVSWTFDALGDGGTLDLSAIMAVPAAPMEGDVISGGTPLAAGSDVISGGSA